MEDDTVFDEAKKNSQLIRLYLSLIHIYGGHAIYFSFTDPERCLIVTGGGDLRNLRRGIGKYKKQYKVEGTIELGDPNLYEAIEKVDTIFLNLSLIHI